MKKNYTVTGMTCSACSARVERCVSKLDGVKRATVNLISGNLSVESDGDLTEKIFNAVKAEGYGIKEGATLKRGNLESGKLLRRIYFSVPLVLILMYIGMGHMIGLPLPKVMHKPFLFTLSQAIIALPVLIINFRYFAVGYKKLFALSPNMDTLVAIGSSVSYLYGVFALVMIACGITPEKYSANLYFEGSAMILTVITIGRFLEEKSKSKTMTAIEKLLDLAPYTATLLVDGEEREVLASELKEGYEVVLKSGFSVPADGVIIRGNGWADESVITGESVPVYKNEGDKVVCGSVFSGGYAVFKAERVGEDTTVYKIAKLVEEANSTKVPIARLADKIAGIFVPAVMGVSLVAFIVWLAVGADVQFALNVGVSVLVVSCPCALGLATPTALMVGTGKSAESGILIKNGVALQTLSAVDAVVLDKTGTITFGNPEIEVYRHIEALSDDEFIGLCASMERLSSHVLAKPIVELSETLNAKKFKVEDFESVAGKGIKGNIEGKSVVIGNLELVGVSAVGGELQTDAKKCEDGGATVFYCATDGEVVGFISIKDKIKPSSKHAVEEFKKMGIGVTVLTGDGEASAKSVASELGVAYKAKVLPGEKQAVIKAMTDSGKTVMMVGDGVNDAPSLASASVGVAIGAGTDIAIESAEVVLVKNELTDAVNAVRLGKAVMRTVKQNLFWAFIYNVILIPIACGALYPFFKILLSPMLGSVAMSLSSVFVVGNALRLKGYKFDEYKGESNMASEKIVKVTVEGMMCEHCKKRAETALSVFGKVEVDLKAKTATIAGCTADDAEIKKVVSDSGYTVTKIER